MQSVTSPSSGLPFDATPPGYLGTFVGPAPAPPITGPALSKYWVLDTAYTAFRFRLQEGNVCFFSFFLPFLFSFGRCM